MVELLLLTKRNLIGYSSSDISLLNRFAILLPQTSLLYIIEYSFISYLFIQISLTYTTHIHTVFPHIIFLPLYCKLHFLIFQSELFLVS